MSRDIPMLYSAPMVRALWDGRKTQTRRLCKDQPPPGVAIIRKTIRPFGGEPYHAFERRTKFGNFGGEVPVKISRGDRIWVKENHYRTDDGHTEYAVYAADENAVREHLQHIDELPATFPQAVRALHRKLRPSIHMPRWASRMTLIVTDVRIERLRDISEADAIAEGIERHHAGWTPYATAFYEADGITPANYHADPRESYRSLWNAINGFGSWDQNPWVVAVSFDVIKQNIDEVRP